MHDFHITLYVPQNCVLIVIVHKVTKGAELGCYGLVSVPVLEILSGGAEYP